MRPLHEPTYRVRSFIAQILGVSFPLLITSGATAYIISSWMLVFVRALGITSYSPRIYWACGLFGRTTGAALFGGRIVRGLALSVVIPLFYAAFFEVAGNADLPIGALVGLVHALVIGISLPIVAARRGCSKAPTPGLFGWRLGATTPLVIVAVYALYGAALGYVYVVVSA